MKIVAKAKSVTEIFSGATIVTGNNFYDAYVS